MDAGQPAQRLREVPVGAGVVDGPVGSALGPVAAVTITITAAASERWIHQPREHPLGFFLIVGRQREVFILRARILAERALEGVNSAQQQKSTTEQAENL